ncbi:MAG: hypothetical protein WD669_12480 [Pirellulales bacterium]
MKVRNLTCMGLAIALIAVSNTRASAEQPSQQTLAAMGLGSLSVMSDDDALAVRGFGYRGSNSSASAWGASYAVMGTRGGSAGSVNAYKASGKHSASGRNLSFAGKLVISSKGGGHNGGGNGGGGYGGGGAGGAMAGRMGNGGHGGGGIKVKAVVVFAGGSSSARAH